MNNFEKQFEAILESNQYDRAESRLFELVRYAYTAGYRAAGGEIPENKKAIELSKSLSRGAKE